MRRVALYTRVSTDQQTTENQERELRQVAERSGWQIVDVFCDAGILVPRTVTNGLGLIA